MRVQYNKRNDTLLLQIPKAIATAKRIKKGTDVDFMINEKGQIILVQK
jgi:hypothetical protein